MKSANRITDNTIIHHLFVAAAFIIWVVFPISLESLAAEAIQKIDYAREVRPALPDWLGDLYDRLPIMVFNDEGHHCWRSAPPKEDEAEPESPRRGRRPKPTGEEAAFEATDEEQAEARVWLEGLDQINNCLGSGKRAISFCVDMSATPFYLKGSGFPEGQPFPWLVSDFGLVDAIESGIVKIPRLPVKDTGGKKDEVGRPDPKTSGSGITSSRH